MLVTVGAQRVNVQVLFKYQNKCFCLRNISHCFLLSSIGTLRMSGNH